MLIIGHEGVHDILTGRETELIDLVGAAYALHDEGQSSLPHSTFLRFPDNTRDRIISLIAYLGGPKPVAGMKWISSFPGNLDLGLPRASAAMVLNSLETGRPEAFIEGSLISAKRTAASAALGAGLLVADQDVTAVSLIACGLINREILRFLGARFPKLNEITVFDLDPARAAAFAERAGEVVPGVTARAVTDLAQAVAASPVVSIASTAIQPHMDLSAAAPGTVVLHISLRDIVTESILDSHNIVDDADHACREGTSLSLAELAVGSRSFIDASVGQLVRGVVDFRPDPKKTIVYSPFGLGVLDIAVAQFVRDAAESAGLGVTVDNFLPTS
ncbi:2,3-diaminopropionate biosynthesis protein SbnB [Longispora fulva]|uniref:Ornithine cyclodeaminase n=1 Tax=Longispora fulva TaxID=619741 RepID=A0A8J7KEK7_9ACTN|nr:2,3-diaminopropionate biosynthesis protein SbnB [Longispora fulva]MBG6135105.1 ornithine cyclodeaminase [Longispora fulva]GIG56660.1 2,3-diaminopropionate biosynthesis protein SbnB [Longispora fulva]